MEKKSGDTSVLKKDKRQKKYCPTCGKRIREDEKQCKDCIKKHGWIPEEFHQNVR